MRGMNIKSPSLRFYLALLGTVFFYFCLFHSAFGLYFPLSPFYFHDAIQVVIPASFFFVAFHPSLKAKLHLAGIIVFSIGVSILCEFVLIMAVGMITA